jgi:hypothetical protein
LLFPKLEPGGIYLVEDTHSSYLPGFNPHNCETFVNYAKRITDSLNGYFSKNVDEFTKWINLITFYESVIVFEKAREPKEEDHAIITGKIFN